MLHPPLISYYFIWLVEWHLGRVPSTISTVFNLSPVSYYFPILDANSFLSTRFSNILSLHFSVKYCSRIVLRTGFKCRPHWRVNVRDQVSHQYETAGMIIIIFVLISFGGTAVAQWLRCCGTNRKVAGSIPDGVIGIFHWHYPSDGTMALGLTQPLTKLSTRRISWG